jgi:mannonate dehydratase
MSRMRPISFLAGIFIMGSPERTSVQPVGSHAKHPGSFNNFAEVYPDEGEMDFLKIMRILRDSEFSLSICPDHMPSHPDDPGKLQAYAFGYGYINALIHAVNSEA